MPIVKGAHNNAVSRLQTKKPVVFPSLRLIHRPVRPYQKHMNDEHIKAELTSLEKRAWRSHLIAWVLVFIITSSVTLLVIFFYKYQGSDFLGSGIEHEWLGSYLPHYEIESSQDPELIRKLMLDFDRSAMEKYYETQMKRLQILSEQNANNNFITSLSISVARIGSVVIVLYYIQILLNLTRYHFRIADHLYMVVRILKVHGMNGISLDQLISMLSIEHIDIGKAPPSLTDRLINAAENIASKKT